MTDRTYIAIDLKSFYASVECIERGPCGIPFHEELRYSGKAKII